MIEQQWSLKYAQYLRSDARWSKAERLLSADSDSISEDDQYSKNDQKSEDDQDNQKFEHD